MQKIKALCQKIKKSNSYIILNRIITLRGCNIFAPSSLAFFIILSLFPCLVLIEILLSLANLSLDQSLSIFSLIFSIDDEVSVSIKEFINNMLVNNIFTFLFCLIECSFCPAFAYRVPIVIIRYAKVAVIYPLTVRFYLG